jgi:predicted TIM-barrel fold metal-dependent hydrolase
MDEIAAHRKRNEMSQFINDFFARTRQKYPTRALFLADVPLGTDPDFSVKELNRAMTQLGLNGVAIQTNNAGKLPHEQIFDDFFSETERLDVPVLLHPGKSPWFDFAYTGLKKYMFESIVGFPADTTITIAYMIIDGFFENHSNPFGVDYPLYLWENRPMGNKPIRTGEGFRKGQPHQDNS